MTIQSPDHQLVLLLARAARRHLEVYGPPTSGSTTGNDFLILAERTFWAEKALTEALR